jgi:hypothetical protein
LKNFLSRKIKTESGEVFGKASAWRSAESSCVVCDPFLTNMEGALCVLLEDKSQ